MSPFFTVHSQMPRQGPGEPADVHWAIKRLGLSGALRICDAACGPGADSRTLAKALPEATIDAMDATPHLVDEARENLQDLPQIAVTQGDMAEITGPYDLIWCAGALYFLGITEGLSKWRRALAPGGSVVFSEPVALGPLSDTAKAFWAEYPALSDLDGIRERVEAARFEMLDHRLIIGAPWESYYAPMEARIARLRASNPSPELTEALDAAALEAARWRAVPDEIAYALILAKPA